MIRLIALALALTACTKSEKDKAKDQPPAPTPGSAAVAVADAAAVAPPPTAKTQDEIAKRYEECIVASNEGSWVKYRGCYTDDATLEEVGYKAPLRGGQAIVDQGKQARPDAPDQRGDVQLVLVSGTDVISIIMLTGTVAAPQSKRLGFLFGEIVAFDAAGRMASERSYYDVLTVAAQTGAVTQAARPVPTPSSIKKVVVTQRNDAAEDANMEVFGKLVAAFNKHDAAALGGVVAAPGVWSIQPQPRDIDGKAFVDQMKTMWSGFSDVKLTINRAWAIGDYVAADLLLEGTNDADVKSLGLKKTGSPISVAILSIHQIADGKVKASWVFLQSINLAKQLNRMPPGPK